MKPFFSIRIDYNPADSDAQQDRDGNSVRVSVARQVDPEAIDETNAVLAMVKAQGSDRKNVVDAFMRAIRFIDRAMEANDRRPLMADIIHHLVFQRCSEETIIELVEDVIEGASDEFIESLQAAIDKERPRKESEA